MTSTTLTNPLNNAGIAFAAWLARFRWLLATIFALTAIPAVLSLVYAHWAAAALAESLARTYGLGLKVTDMTMLPVWPMIKAVGTVGPLVYFGLVTLPVVWHFRRATTVEACLCFGCLGLAWGMTLAV